MMTEELDIKEAAALCKCSDKTLRRRIKDKAGHPPYWTIGLRYCFDRQAIAKAAQEWRGMESAPKDGTFVLVIDSEYGDHSGAFVAQYSQHSFSGCWLTSHTPHVVYPTHWMPLPTPPQEQSHD